MEGKKFVFIDTETSGLDISKHEMLSIGGIVCEWIADNTLKIITSFDFKIIPEHIETADERALRVNKYSKEKWHDARSLKEVMKDVSVLTKDAIMVSHNVAFDAGFVDQAFFKTGIKNEMHYHRLDTLSIAFALLGPNQDVRRYSLLYLCEYFDIKNTDPHTAFADTEALAKLFAILMKCKIQ